MATTKKITAHADVTLQVLERTPVRATKFMQGIQFKPIRASLQKGGFRKADFDEGVKLLRRALGAIDDATDRPLFAPMSDEIADAIKELDAWDESGYRRARAALVRLHPEQAEYVFKGLSASTGMQAALGVMTFLDRLDALENGADRKDSRKADRAALQTLAQRGIDEKERARLRKLTKIVGTSPDLDLDGLDEDEQAREVERQTALVALRAWFIDWSETARSVIGRRDHLIRLGLAQKKANGSIVDVEDDSEDDDDAPVAPKKSNGAKTKEEQPVA